MNDKEDDGVPYVVEGIGNPIPDVLPDGPEAVDYWIWIKTTDAEAYAAVELMRKERLLVGSSSGSALGGTLAWFKTDVGKKMADAEGANVMVLLPGGWAFSSSPDLFLLSSTSPPPGWSNWYST